MFAELLALAKPEIPELTIECFFVLYQSLGEVIRVSKSWQKDQEETSNSVSSDVKNNIENETLVNAACWVGAALSVDLAPLSLFCKQFESSCQEDRHVSSHVNESKKESSESISSTSQNGSYLKSISSSVQGSSCTPNKIIQAKMVNQHKNEKKYNNQEGRHPSPFRALKQNMGVSNAKNVTVKPTSTNVDSLFRLNGMQETSDLAMHLMLELQRWFLKYVEGALDSCGSPFSCAKDEEAQEENHIACMLSQIKRVNEWMDMVESDEERPLDTEVVEILERVKRKVYEFILQNVFTQSSSTN